MQASHGRAIGVGLVGVLVVLFSTLHARAAGVEDPDAAARVTVFVNAKIFTAEPTAPYAEAVAVAGDRILAVGQRQSVIAKAGAAARVVDLQGRFLMPGLIDGHAHPIGHKLLLGGGGMGLVLDNYTAEDVSLE